MINQHTSVILIEDDEDDYLLTLDMLEEIEQGRFNLQWVSTYEAALSAIRNAQADVYLVDYRLGAYNGMDLLHEAISQGMRAPIILLTGQGNRAIDLEAMQAGAADYLVKGHIDSFLLERSIRYAIERRQAEETIRQNAARAEALARLAARLNTRLDLEAVLAAVSEETARSLDAPASAVRLYDPQQDALYYAHAFGLPAHYREYTRPSPGAIYEGTLRQKGSVRVTDDVQTFETLPNAELYRQFDIRTVVTAPMWREGLLIGGLTAFSLGQMRQFSAAELALLQGLADQTAQAIVNARLFAETKRRLAYVQALRAIDVAITSSFDIRLTLNVILDQVTTQLGVDAADLLILYESLGILEFAVGRGFNTGAVQPHRLRLSDSQAGRVALERRTMYIPNLAHVDNKPKRFPLLTSEAFVAYWGVPLIAKGQIKGVLEIYHRAHLLADPEWLEFMETLAGQAAIAIDNATLFSDLQRSNVELSLACDAIIEGWSNATASRVLETEEHLRRVTDMTVRFAQLLGLPETEITNIRRGALLHDIGKLRIPDHILLKSEPLTAEDLEVMNKHPVYAYEMLSAIAHLRPALDIPYAHHEKWDGTGYPRGLKGDLIPLAARLFAIADAWDAFQSDGAQSRPLSDSEKWDRLNAGSGTHFDPDLLTLILKVMHEM